MFFWYCVFFLRLFVVDHVLLLPACLSMKMGAWVCVHSYDICTDIQYFQCLTEQQALAVGRRPNSDAELAPIVREVPDAVATVHVSR